MKTTINNEPAPLVSGAMPTVSMGISDNAEDQLMILNVLSNTLYSDKIAAVLREYGCNAADANVEAGKGDLPIEVRLPNRLDLSVSIRDFGYGMTEDQIANVFCRLGRSTKRNSNAFTGMLGIGSKAGFAYGDHFLVTSWTGGVKIVYNAYRDQGVPKLAKMHEEPSDAPDGIEVKVPVRQEDADEFVRKAERVYRYFKVRPIIHGAKVEWDDRAQEYAGTGWRYTGSGKSVAIMGNVGYDLNASAMGYHNVYRYGGGDPDPVECLIGLGVEVDFEIGDLEIAANREGLQYKDLTKAAIKQRLLLAASEIGQVFTGKISGASSLWEAKRYYHENFEQLRSGGHYTLNQVVKGQVMWNGKVIKNSFFTLENKEKTPGVAFTRITRRGRVRGGTMIGLRNYSSPDSVTPDGQITLVVNDLPAKKQSPARMRGWFEANANCRDIYVFTFADANAQATYWKNRGLDNAPTVLMSTITPWFSPTSQGGGNGTKNSKHSAKVFVLNEKTAINKYSAKSSWWDTEKVDIKNDTGVYVVIEQFAVRQPGIYDHPSVFRTKVERLRTAGLITGPVYGFKPDKAAKLGKNWKRLEVAVKAVLDKILATKAQALADLVAAEGFNEFVDIKFRSSFPVGSQMREHLDAVYSMRNTKGPKALLNVDISPWCKQPALPDPSINLDTQRKKMLQIYPMFDLVGVSQISNASDVVKIADYVKLVGK
jgi:hypothetical protein